MSAYYEAAVTVAGHSWTIENGDTPNSATDVLGGLELGWVMPDGDLSPTQPEPMYASFAIRVDDVENVSIDIGDPVAIEVRVDPGGTPRFQFYGQVADMGAVPVDGGAVLSVVAVDYTADERPVGLVEWDGEPVSFRLERVWAEANAGALPTLALTGADPDLPARSASGTTLPAYVEEVLPCWIGDTADDDPARYILAPNISGGVLDPGQNFTLDPLPNVATDPPAEFAGLSGGLYGLTVAPDAASFVVDGCFVRRDLGWRRRKFGAFNLIVLTDTGGDSIVYGPRGMESTNDRYTERTIVAGLTCPWDTAFFLPELRYYFDAANATNRWEIESFTYELSRHIEAGLDPADVPLWFPDHTAPEGDGDRTSCYRRPVVVTEIPGHQNLGPGDFYAGLLTRARLVISGGKNSRMSLEFGLRRALPRPDAGEALTPAGLAGSSYAAVTVADLDPDFTVYDYRLAKEPAA